MSTPSKILAAAVIAASTPLLAGAASAAPLSGSLALKNAATPAVETVQWRRGGVWRGGRWIGPAAGVAAGAIVGGALVGAPGYGYDYAYGPGYSYDYGNYAYAPGYYGSDNAYTYDQPYVAVTPAMPADSQAYCAQRFRSYDPASGTYLGYDGIRHPCP